MVTSDNRAGPVVLIGASGRVGRMVCRHWPDPSGLLVARRHQPVATDGLLWAPLEGPRALLDHLSITGVRPAALLMLAGVTPGPGVDDAALMQGNTGLALACLEAAEAAAIDRVLLASSSAIYGVHPAGHAFDETAQVSPVSGYGRAKLAMEALAKPFRAAGMEVCAVRIGNVAGADALLHPLAAAMTAPAAPRRPIRLDAFADGLGPLRSYIGPETLARVLHALCLHPSALPEVLNVAASVPVRMQDLARAAGWPCEMVTAAPSAHQCITLDCRRLVGLCLQSPDDSDPVNMVAQWKATLSA